MTMRPPRIGLRLLLLVALLPLVALPWIGLRFVERIAELARDAQWETQQTAARSLAASLHERRELFGGDTGRIPRGVAPIVPDSLAALRGEGSAIGDRRAGTGADAIVDAKVDADAAAQRWRDVARRNVPVLIAGSAPATTLRLRLALARATGSPRVLLRVEADDERFVAPGDLQTAGGGPVVQPGDSVTVLVGDDEALVAALAADDRARATGAAQAQLPELSVRIPAALHEDATGWHAEVELPAETRLIQVVATDVDYLGSRSIEATADSGVLLVVAPPDPALQAAAARHRDRQWDAVLRAMDRGGGRISIVDAGGRLLAQRGEVAQAPPPPAGPAARLARGLLAGALRFGGDDDPDRGDAARGAPITTALTGVPARAATRLASDSGMPAWQLASAHPIWIGDHVAGALLLEDSTVTRLALAQQALERLALLVAAALLATLLALLAVATLAVARIVRLRRGAEAAIDARGRVVGEVPRFRLRDEVDALADSYNRVLARLREHQDYLAKLRARLIHELRTPIMVVRSSLDNLSAELNGEGAAAEPAGSARDTAVAAYAQRAQAGAARLERIVSGMGEAGSLETLLEASDLEPLDLVALAGACVDGYRTAYPGAALRIAAAVAAAPCLAVPEAIAQALDKLVANAIDFARPGTEIVVRIGAAGSGAGSGVAGGRAGGGSGGGAGAGHRGGYRGGYRGGQHGGQRARPAWSIAVANQGPPLPAVMVDSLFESMVSIRGGGAVGPDPRGHLGLGLYLVRLIAEFHGGAAFARNIAGGVEVGFTVAAER
ncbi:MAG: hypothetical protein AB7G13_32215 [Lautropia sp.]